MRFLILRPRPDELTTSALIRSAHLAGMPLSRLMGLAFGARSPRLLLSWSHVANMASCLHVSAQQLLFRHTIFSFASCLLSGEELESRKEEALRGDMSFATAAFHRHAPRVSPRWCPDCVTSDLAMHGESYWRVTHNLPGVFLCLRHRRPLVTNDAINIARPIFLANAELPHQVSEFKSVIESATPYYLQLADAAVRRFRRPLTEFTRRGAQWAMKRISDIGLSCDERPWLNKELGALVTGLLGDSQLLVFSSNPAKSGWRTWCRVLENPELLRTVPLQYLALQAALELPNRLVSEHLSESIVLRGRLRDGHTLLDIERATKAKAFIDRRLQTGVPTSRSDVLSSCQTPLHSNLSRLPLLQAELRRLDASPIRKAAAPRPSRDADMARIARKLLRKHLKAEAPLTAKAMVRACGLVGHPNKSRHPLLCAQIYLLLSSPISGLRTYDEEDLARKAERFIDAWAEKGKVPMVKEVTAAIGLRRGNSTTRFPLLRAVLARLKANVKHSGQSKA